MSRAGKILLVVAVVALPFRARAISDAERRKAAAQEIDRELQQLVKPPPPPAVRVLWEGIDSDKFDLDEARFEIDDERLSYGELTSLAAQAKEHRALYDSTVAAGKHHLLVNLVVHRTKVSLFEGLRTTTFKVSTDVPFPAAAGLLVNLRVGLHVNEQEQDVKKRLELRTRVEPKMVASVDDTPLPEASNHTASAVPIVAAAEPPAREEPASAHTESEPAPAVKRTVPPPAALKILKGLKAAAAEPAVVPAVAVVPASTVAAPAPAPVEVDAGPAVVAAAPVAAPTPAPSEPAPQSAGAPPYLALLLGAGAVCLVGMGLWSRRKSR